MIGFYGNYNYGPQTAEREATTKDMVKTISLDDRILSPKLFRNAA